MKKNLLISLFVVVISILITCEQQPPVTHNYYPNKDQSEWLYKDVILDKEYLEKLNGTDTHALYGPVQVLEITSDNKTDKRYIQLVDSDGDGNTDVVIFYYDLKTDARTELIHYPATVGQKWSWKVGDITYNGEVIAMETVTVEAGTFKNCPKIQYSYGGQVQDVEWFADGVGMVRDALESYYDWQLKSWTFPQ